MTETKALTGKMREFWRMVEEKALELRRMENSGELAKLQGSEHAIDGGAWITSLPPDWTHGPTRGPGNVVCGRYNFYLVARKVMETTHRLSTAAEVNDFLTRSRAAYAAMKQGEDLRDGKRTVVVEAVAPTPGAAK